MDTTDLTTAPISTAVTQRIHTTTGLPSGFLTFILTDIEGSTPLVCELGDDRYRELIQRHRRIIRQCLERSGGYEVETEGDSFLLVFTDAQAALRCATRIQFALADTVWPYYGYDRPVRPRVRIAAHSGYAEASDQGYSTIEIHRTARICSATHGDQILISEQCRAAAHEPHTIHIGDYDLKGLNESLSLYQLTTPGLRADFAPPPVRRRRHNLPQPYSHTITHPDQMERINRALEVQRLITLTGLPRSGKTTTALSWAHAHLDEFEGGVWYVNTDDLGGGLLRALGKPVEPFRAPLDTAIEHVRDRRSLVVVDGQDPRPDPGRLRALLDACPRLRVIVCAREAVGLEGESTLPQLAPGIERCAKLLRQGVRAHGSDLDDTDARRIVNTVDCFVPAFELLSQLVAVSGPIATQQELTNNPCELFEHSVVDHSVHSCVRALDSTQEGLFRALLTYGSARFGIGLLMRTARNHGAHFSDLKRMIDMALLVPTSEAHYRIPAPIRWLHRPRWDDRLRPTMPNPPLSPAWAQAEQGFDTPSYVQDGLALSSPR